MLRIEPLYGVSTRGFDPYRGARGMTWKTGCLHCGHWWHHNRTSIFERADEAPSKGWCTISPQWVETAQTHFCSHMTGNDQDTAAERVMRGERDDWFRKEYHLERERRLKLQKDLKEARRKLREAKVP